MKLRDEMIALALMLAIAGTSAMTGCSAGNAGADTNTVQETVISATETEETGDSGEAASTSVITKDNIVINDTLDNSENGGHAITADGESASYSNTAVTKTGDSSGDEADFYGENAAVFAENGAALELSEMVINTAGTHANAVFSYGKGTSVTVSDSVIETSGNCSGGLMTTGGGTMNASNLNVHTTGNSSAAIRSDRGGGTVTVSGGQYVTDGTGSPVIYSTADITVNDAELESTASQGVVVEGKNSVTLNNVTLTANNVTKNSDKSDWYQAVMIYQSMSGDAAEGLSSFTMTGGTLNNLNGDIFFVNNTVTEITLNGADIINKDSEGVFLRAAAAGWGSEGSNGGQVTLHASGQTIDGDMLVDSVSHLNLYLRDSSVFTGSVNPDGQEGSVYVEIENGSKWVLTSDSYITGLTCEPGSIELNGHTLYINGKAWDGKASEGTAIEAQYSSGGGMGGPGGQPPEGGGPGGKPPEGPGGEPPAKP